MTKLSEYHSLQLREAISEKSSLKVTVSVLNPTPQTEQMIFVIPYIAAGILLLGVALCLYLARQDRTVWPRTASIITVCAATRMAGSAPRRAFFFVSAAFVALYLATTALQLVAVVQFVDRCSATTFPDDPPIAIVAIEATLFIFSLIIVAGLIAITVVPFVGEQRRLHTNLGLLFFTGGAFWSGLGNATSFFVASMFADLFPLAIVRLVAMIVLDVGAGVTGAGFAMEAAKKKLIRTESETKDSKGDDGDGMTAAAAAGANNQLARAWFVIAAGEMVFGVGFIVSVASCSLELLISERVCPTE